MKPFRVFAEMVDLQPIIDKKNDSKIVGLLVARVSAKSMAERAGLRRGMVITSIQGMRVEGLSEGELAQRTAKLPPTRFHTLIVAARQSYGSRGEREYEVVLPRATSAAPRPEPGTGRPRNVSGEAATATPLSVAVWQVDILSAGITTLEDEASISEIVVSFQRPKPTSRANLELPREFTVNVWDGTGTGAVVGAMKIVPITESGHERFVVSFQPWRTNLARGQVLGFRLTAEGNIDFTKPAVWRGFKASFTVKSLGKTIVLDEESRWSFSKRSRGVIGDGLWVIG